MAYSVTFENTPNPQSMKFVINQNVVTEPVAFVNSTEASQSPLAEKLFGFPWMSGVFIGLDFVTVTKQDWVEWDVLAEPLRDLIEEHLNEGIGVAPGVKAQDDSPQPKSDDPTVLKIMEIIERDVRPAVAMDGGDIIFQRYENNIVYLRMKGSCAGCPSSTQTLKLGIETRLKEAVPEIIEVVAV